MTVRRAHDSSERSSNTVRNRPAQHTVHRIFDVLYASQALTANDEDDADRSGSRHRAHRMPPDACDVCVDVLEPWLLVSSKPPAHVSDSVAGVSSSGGRAWHNRR